MVGAAWDASFLDNAHELIPWSPEPISLHRIVELMTESGISLTCLDSFAVCDTVELLGNQVFWGGGELTFQDRVYFMKSVRRCVWNKC